MLVLYDLQESLKTINAGPLKDAPYLSAMRDECSSDVINVQDVKTIHCAGRVDMKPGIIINTRAMEQLRPGDKITVTGRVGSGAPTSDWAIAIDRRRHETAFNVFSVLAQCISPLHSELFSVTYLLEPEDLKCPIMIRTNLWGNTTGYMDYFIDNVLITRSSDSVDIEPETRGVIYSLDTDDGLISLKPNDVQKFIRASGQPKYTLSKKDGKKSILVERRMNHWDGIDLLFADMGIKQGNIYTIKVRGKIEEPAPPNSRIMLQIIPGFIWQSEVFLTDDREFTLEHTFPAMQLQTLEAVRITTDTAGAEVSFTIYDMEVTGKPSLE